MPLRLLSWKKNMLALQYQDKFLMTTSSGLARQKKRCFPKPFKWCTAIVIVYLVAISYSLHYVKGSANHVYCTVALIYLFFFLKQVAWKWQLYVSVLSLLASSHCLSEHCWLFLCQIIYKGPLCVRESVTSPCCKQTNIMFIPNARRFTLSWAVTSASSVNINCGCRAGELKPADLQEARDSSLTPKKSFRLIIIHL